MYKAYEENLFILDSHLLVYRSKCSRVGSYYLDGIWFDL